jgi:flagellar P-ring protein precursor FlgI
MTAHTHLLRTLTLAATALALLALQPAHAMSRIKDLTTIAGVRANQLFGYGLVIGLDGTGDQVTQTPFTAQATASMLAQQGINIPPGTNMQTRNIAAVMVTGMLPPFAQPGQQIDVTVSSIGNSRSLRGGTLLITPLKGVDGQVYALAQGSLIVGGAGAEAGGNRKVVNTLSSGRVPSGAIVERAVGNVFTDEGPIRLELTRSDFGDARRVADLINKKLGAQTAVAVNGRVLELNAPRNSDDRVGFVALVQEIPIAPNKEMARVVINARTGSVAMNDSVRLEPCAVTHGNLTVQIKTTPIISQPAPLSGGSTVVANRTDIDIKADTGELMRLEGADSLTDLVKALNSMGASPQDLISILQAIKQTGSLYAEIEVI